MHYTYILKCGDGSLYCGYTTNLEKRIKAHNSGAGAKYTRSRLPVTLAYFEEFEEKIPAMQREWEIKQLTRAKKLELINGGKKMELKIIKDSFCVCKCKTPDNINFSSDFVFYGKTDEELSVVCRESDIPKDAYEISKHWRAFRIEGVLDFSLIGILSKISGILADAKIGIFAISTYNTDYILTKEESFDKAIKALKNKNYIIKE